MISENNLPTVRTIERLHHKYAPNDKLYELVYGHCQIVAEIALWCAENIEVKVKIDKPLLQAVALLHDIGSYVFLNEDGNFFESNLYPLHAILGARILADEGLPIIISDTISTHILLGLTKDEIVSRPWPLPERNYEPKQIEGELLCYADRFHSKKPTFNDYEVFLKRLKSDLPLQASKFESWSKRFGIPDIDMLSKKYGHSVR